MKLQEVEVPEELPTVETCSVPGCESPRAERMPGARGKAPTKCVEHKGASSAKTPTVRVRGNVSDAADFLVLGNTFAAGALHVAGYEATAAALSNDDVEAKFRRAVERSLASNPKLAAKILKLAEKSGSVGLFGAYVILGQAVAPVAMLEYQTKRAERREMATDGDDT